MDSSKINNSKHANWDVYETDRLGWPMKYIMKQAIIYFRRVKVMRLLHRGMLVLNNVDNSKLFFAQTFKNDMLSSTQNDPCIIPAWTMSLLHRFIIAP
jgi:hypothetical protein